jgi:hypothetical protein
MTHDRRQRQRKAKRIRGHDEKERYGPLEKDTSPQMRQDRRNPEHECGAKRNGAVCDAPRVNYRFRRIPVHRTPIRRTAKQANQQHNGAMKYQLTGVSIHSCFALALQNNPPVL